MIAIDASALLAFLFHEAGHGQVEPHLSECCMSTVNLAEVIGRFVRDGHDGRMVLRKLSSTQIKFIPFSSEHAALAGTLLKTTYPLGLALGDRACLALALSQAIPALTADRTWLQLDIGVEIKVIR